MPVRNRDAMQHLARREPWLYIVEHILVSGLMPVRNQDVTQLLRDRLTWLGIVERIDNPLRPLVH
ncbi:hypothetical protein D3C87_1831980 [compost metagenome]